MIRLRKWNWGIYSKVTRNVKKTLNRANLNSVSCDTYIFQYQIAFCMSPKIAEGKWNSRIVGYQYVRWYSTLFNNLIDMLWIQIHFNEMNKYIPSVIHHIIILPLQRSFITLLSLHFRIKWCFQGYDDMFTLLMFPMYLFTV